MENIRGISENTEKGLQAIPANSWPLHGVRGLQVSQISPVVVVFVSLKLIDKWAAVLTIKPKFYNLQPFATMLGDIVHCIQDDHMFL